MTKLSWNDSGQRIYENGVSKGVFYDQDSKGFPWNGFTSVEQSNVDSAEPLYYDGLKYADIVTLGDFEGVLKAFTYPQQFLEYEGTVETVFGVSLTAQQKIRFGISWRTEINSDLGQSIGYKLHILYNVLAIPSQRVYETLSLDNDPIDFQWDISAIPPKIDKFRPTAHLIIDSRRIDPLLLEDIEGFLYGTSTSDAYLPDLNALISYAMNWGRFIIKDNGDGTWTANSPVSDFITILDAESFSITVDTAEYLDPPANTTYNISSDQEAPP